MVFFKREDTIPDQDITGGGIEYEMADFLEGIRIRYFDGTLWLENWDSVVKKSLPERVRVELIPKPVSGFTRTYTIEIPVMLSGRKPVTSGEPSEPGSFGGIFCGKERLKDMLKGWSIHAMSCILNRETYKPFIPTFGRDFLLSPFQG